MAKLPETIYTPESSASHPFKMLAEMFRDFSAGRELAWRIAIRDFNAQYRQSFLGFAWAIINPLANTVAWIFLSTSGVISVNSTDLPYPVYVFVGTMLWSIFLDAVNSPSQVTNNARTMLSKINFPREALIFSGLYTNAFNAAIKISLLLVVPVYLHLKLNWFIALFPLGVFSLIFVGYTIGLLITPLGMLYTDILKISTLFFQFVFYVTPAALPIPTAQWAALIFEYNPLTPLIETTRDWLTGQPPNLLMPFLIVMAVTLGVFCLAWALYRLAMPIVIERMSA